MTISSPLRCIRLCSVVWVSAARGGGFRAEASRGRLCSTAPRRAPPLSTREIASYVKFVPAKIRRNAWLRRGCPRKGSCVLCRSGDEGDGGSETSKPAMFLAPGKWLRAQKMTPKRWALAALAVLALAAVLQRVALLGLVGLERLIIGVLISAENAIFAGLTSVARVAGLAGALVALAYASYLFIVAEDTSKKDK